ncbi:RING-H2 finger protein ATL60 [Platanthera guangdongensis]|uniref:RING-type E3 ubiquitin transferase n=1 Tax=Platanthera guangdongensis TaxID=2320717 RepID=A0ABR2LQ71_9ASPA
MGSTDLSSGDGYESSDGSGIGVRISSEVMVASVIFLFLVVIFVFFLYLYAKYYWGRNLPGRRRAHFFFAAAGGDAPISSRGLDASVLRSLPVSLYSRSDFKDGLECSVCLCELSDGEEVRLLPKCNHGFHLRCIDMWLHSHSTCPLCRCSLGQEAAEAPPVSDGSVTTVDDAAVVPPESPVFPTNVLFWGNQERVNARGSFPQQATSGGSSPRPARTLVISLPNRMVEGFPSPMSPLPSSRFPSENVKSPAEDGRSPGTSKFRSLRRLWSRGKRSGGSPSCSSSPMGGDIEQGFGEGSSNVPKTPTAAGS